MFVFEDSVCFGHQQHVFTLSDEVSRISVRAKTLKKAFLYLYLYDPEGELRTSFVIEKPLSVTSIGVESASLGGIAGKFSLGEWRIEIFNLEGEFRREKAMDYQIQVDVQLATDTQSATDSYDLSIETVNCMNSDRSIDFDMQRNLMDQAQWYRGDLHAHTLLSDGSNTLEEATDIAESQNLDFLFLTEHNLAHPRLPKSDTCLFLPAYEVTTDLGHFNLHGPDRALDVNKNHYKSKELIEQGRQIAQQIGANLCVNHAMMKPWHWHYADMKLASINTLEIICDPTWSTSSRAAEEALVLLSAMWNNGHKIAGVGGSDSHLKPDQRNPNATEPSLYGDPLTWVFANNLSGVGIVEGLKAGHVYFERHCQLGFNINKGALLPSQGVDGGDVVHQINVGNVSQPFYAERVVDGVVLERIQLSEEHITFTTNLADAKWVRIDIRRGQLIGHQEMKGELEGMINPVFNLQNPIFAHPVCDTWGELVETI
ncbi:CehA/McbA family metallohydrolase [Vibrio tapetis]|uniref:Polymerase/histidinol phosphatase N-terminal domain-containing protein n=1 Tax=Vibrio tapetis subsp. tapetis TaxID=1671868 RepID=A0A2N8ZCN1_9VIBR|nr:CehA/McbA family metallohydrolase [Vibrio tapetis]SON49656.1 conserved protein of unknown function [Vibrio tapetis subsp. tapetis]